MRPAAPAAGYPALRNTNSKFSIGWRSVRQIWSTVCWWPYPDVGKDIQGYSFGPETDSVLTNSRCDQFDKRAPSNFTAMHTQLVRIPLQLIYTAQSDGRYDYRANENIPYVAVHTELGEPITQHANDKNSNECIEHPRFAMPPHRHA